ncbi:hypothetical protein [Nonomuraea sp. NPDC052265]|uniref:hypothetical protein n=1 Tax=Nonomuraea sp. NPDC052265 TaxID=3364374 RepID=UPI0037CCC18E
MLAACATGRPAPPVSPATPATTASPKPDVLTDRLGPPMTNLTGTCSPGSEIYALGGIGSERWAQDTRPALWLLKP